jgi:hypothetical protein
MRPHLHNNQRKVDWRSMAQVVECLLCKCKALSLKPSPTWKEKEKKRREKHGSEGTAGTGLVWCLV